MRPPPDGAGPPASRKPPPGAGTVRKHLPRRREQAPGPVCAVCMTPLHPLIAPLTNTHPCCDPLNLEPIDPA